MSESELLSDVSDDTVDIDVESDGDYSDSDLEEEEEEDENQEDLSSSDITQYSSCSTPAIKRMHHNRLERKRRNTIKDYFMQLKRVTPTLQKVKTASRAKIMRKAAEYIREMKHNTDFVALRQKITTTKQSINNIEQENEIMRNVIKDYCIKRGMNPPSLVLDL